MWDSADEYWGEKGQLVEAWAKPIVQRGTRPMLEMAEILPGADPAAWTNNPRELER